MKNEHELRIPTGEQAKVGLRALKTIASGDGSLPPGARRLLEAAQRVLLGTAFDLDALAPIAPDELRSALAGSALGAQLAGAMVLVVMVDGTPSEAAAARLRAFTGALGVDEPAVRTLELFANGHTTLGKLDWLRRSHIRSMAEAELAQGLEHSVKALLGFRGLREDATVAEPYRALADLPEGTLGRALHEHYRRHGFALPGEKHGFPEGGVFHDATHVLGGYDTDPLGELQVGAFTAGYRQKDPLYMAMLPLLLFVDRINVTPIAHDEVDDFFSQPEVAETFLTAFRRGLRCREDLSAGWDFWVHARRPIADVRRDLGIE